MNNLTPDSESTRLVQPRNNTLFVPFEVIDDETGEPVDDAFTSGWFTLKKKKTAPDSEAICQNPVEFTSDTAGNYFATAEQLDIPAGTYFYDVKLISPASGPVTIVNDTLQIVQTVTDRSA